ncbi:MAG: DNA (cytosine-5-)-methyltransferase [Akkermansia sp.]|nr:DNA (cytosine-5-)-methyltransferase [Akkermansia sp.]
MDAKEYMPSLFAGCKSGEAQDSNAGSEVTFIDLFAGLGGIRLGFSQGFAAKGIQTRCVFSSEIKSYAIDAYRGFYGDEEIMGDITVIPTSEIPNFDYLLAGFPCQPFSSAGSRKGFLDTRGTLFFEIERILKEKMDAGKPAKGFLLENVEGLVNHEGGATLKTIISHLEDLGYQVNAKVLDSQFFGLAQSRKRIYIAGTLAQKISLDDFEVTTATLGEILENGQPTSQSRLAELLLRSFSVDELKGKSIKDKRGGDNNIHSWDIGLKGRTTAQERKLLSSILLQRRKKQWAEEIGIEWMDGMPLTEEQIRTFFDVPNLSEMLDKLTAQGYLSYEYPKKQTITANGAKIRTPDITLPKGYNIVAGKLSFEFSKILDPDELAPTLVATDANKLGVIDGVGIRRLTIRECQRLCGYPDSYNLSMVSESEAYDLLGNTVCVPVIKKIAERIAENEQNCTSSV